MKRYIVPAALAAISIVLGIVFRHELVAWFTGKRTGGATSAPVRIVAGGLTIDTAIEPSRPRTDGNTAHVEVHDASGAPVAGAQVRVEYDMPAMATMAAMHGGNDAHDHGAGKYTADFDLPMTGSYTLLVKVTAASATVTARYSIATGRSGLSALGGEGEGGRSTDATTPLLAKLELPAPALTALENAFAAYDVLRGALARDSKDGAVAPARAVAAAIRTADRALATGPSDVTGCLEQGAAAADAIASAKDLDEAREQFSQLSRFLIALAAADPRLQTGWKVETCSMTKTGFNRWFQHDGPNSNPYLGQQMPTCGEASSFEVVAPPTGAGAGSDADQVAYYTCAMHPSVRANHPGTCPECPMPLRPVTKGEVATGVIRVAEERRSVLGIGTSKVVRAPLDLAITAVGKLTFDETRLADVTIKVSGYITELRVNATGQSVKKGQTLFTLYSPELYAAEQEYLLARQGAAAATATGMTARSDALMHAAETKLHLWGLSAAQIAAVAAKGEPQESVPFPSPASGVVLEKDVVEGDAVQAGMRLFRIASLDQIWVEADVYEGDLAKITKGQTAKVSLTYLPGKTFDGKVTFVYPYLDPATRTGRVRIALPNQGLELKPDMYATVDFQIPLGDRLQVPVSAVVYTGPRRLVFVDLGDGRIRPQEITIGARNGDQVEVLSGLKEGDMIVTSGTFLVAAESRVRSASTFWEDTDAGK